MRVILIYNSKAGDDNRGAEMLALVQAAGHQVRAIDKKADFSESLRGPADLVVAAGGDGTVAKVARHMVGSDIPFTLLPIGTANNLAFSLGLDGDPELLIAGWNHAVVRPMDAVITEHPEGKTVLFESAGVGLFTEAMCHATSREHGEETRSAEERFARDFRFLRRLAGTLEPVPCTVTVDGETTREPVLLLEIMNSRQIGSRVLFAPRADMADGELDLVLVTERDRALLQTFLDRGPLDDYPPHLPVRRGTHVRVSGTGGRIHLGDDIVRIAGSDEPWTLDARIHPGAVRLLVPAT